MNEAKFKKLMNDSLSFVESNDMDRALEYIQRGRQFSTLPDQELIELWVTVYDADPVSSSTQGSRGMDLSLEASLRKLKLPYECVANAVEKLTQYVQNALAEGRIDEEQYNADFQAFQARQQN